MGIPAAIKHQRSHPNVGAEWGGGICHRQNHIHYHVYGGTGGGGGGGIGSTSADVIPAPADATLDRPPSPANGDDDEGPGGGGGGSIYSSPRKMMEKVEHAVESVTETLAIAMDPGQELAGEVTQERDNGGAGEGGGSGGNAMAEEKTGTHGYSSDSDVPGPTV